MNQISSICAFCDNIIGDGIYIKVSDGKYAHEYCYDERGSSRSARKKSFSSSSSESDSDFHPPETLPPKPRPVEENAILYLIGIPRDVRDKSSFRIAMEADIRKQTNLQPRYTELLFQYGIGLMQFERKAHVDLLVNDVQRLNYTFDGRKSTVSFVKQFELAAYIVVKPNQEDEALPSAREVEYQWNRFLNQRETSYCQPFPTPFSNIFHTNVSSYDTFKRIETNRDFRIGIHMATLFLGAECNFIEALNESIDEGEIRASIMETYSFFQTASKKIYIQLSKTTRCACILIENCSSNVTDLVIQQTEYPLKKRMPMVLRIGPIREQSDVERIMRHQYFPREIRSSKTHNRYLRIELADQSIFENLLEKKKLRLDNGSDVNVVLQASIETSSEEIDEDTWYKTEMIHQKPDIMNFIREPQHRIFQNKWNATVWKNQMEKALNDEDHGKESRDENSANRLTRQLLRVTVMLNTIGVLKEKSYSIGDRTFQLNLNEKLKTIVYDDQSLLMARGKMMKNTPPFKFTTVDVHNEDCLLTYERLVRNKSNPLLLNMANALTPGGGYRKGEAAQEENLFRRSDYCRSLDIDSDDWLSQNSTRKYCSRTGNFDTLPNGDKFYPISKFGAIYTSGVTVFRQSEDAGYEFMEKPLNNVSIIAVPAFRDPDVSSDGMLKPKYAVYTRKKIENLFAIAYFHKHDTLVLSAFGCGAFKNPPEHIAKIFESVIDQYAGFFKSIHFSIIDDHNAHKPSNPLGNFEPFREVFRHPFQAPKQINKRNTKIGPFLILSEDLSFADVTIHDKRLCFEAALCKKLHDTSHFNEYEHPPLCTNMDAEGHCDFDYNPVHRRSFIHPSHCEEGGLCKNIDDAKHTGEYLHPGFCSVGAKCTNNEREHLKDFRHLPTCPNADTCYMYIRNDTSHCQQYRHLPTMCRYKSFCANFHSEEHRNMFKHPFKIPCPHTPYQCAMQIEYIKTNDKEKLRPIVQDHCTTFSHVCLFGSNCHDKRSEHWEKTIHVARKQCPDGQQCKRLLDEDHLNSTTHPQINDIRILCEYDDSCRHRGNVDHVIKYRHTNTFVQNSLLRYFNLNKSISFAENHQFLIDSVISYAQTNNWNPLPSGDIPADILRWIQTVKPIHRCKLAIFQSILLHGHVMSRAYMDKLKNPQRVADSILNHSQIRSIEPLKQKAIEKVVRNYIVASVKEIFTRNGILILPADNYTDGHEPDTTDLKDPSELIKSLNIKLLSVLSRNDVDVINGKTKEIAEDSIKLNSTPTGVGSGLDKLLETDKHVFSILGPHLGHYYGDIVIVFKREILHHPDANLTSNAAATVFHGAAFKTRPWLGKDPGNQADQVKMFHKIKCSAAVAGYERAIALELMALASLDAGKSSLNITLNEIIQRAFKVDSHWNIEAHLPQLIPINYIDYIYMPRNVYKLLNAASKTIISSQFKNRMKLIDHDGFSDEPLKFVASPIAPESFRNDYQQKVAQDVRDEFLEVVHNKYSKIPRGIAIMIPPSDFTETYLLPITIKQSFEQYRFSKHNRRSGAKLIFYWEIMQGDMMVSLTDFPITGNESKSGVNCLSCYIAGKPSAQDSNSYHEDFTYINDSLPLQHSLVRNSNQIAGRSARFFVGCDTEHAITLCMEIDFSKSTVTLSHAGPNSIYSREKVTADFGKRNIDLRALNHVYISAGSQTVPVNSLFIAFEKVDELHPTFDKNYHWANLNPEPHPRKLIPCVDNVNCLRQHSKTESDIHNAKYSHPCRFSELCQKMEDHLTHEKHHAPDCRYDKSCEKLHDPYHRAEYRHTNLPDYLYPCHDRKNCTDKSRAHCMKYSHGEDVYKSDDSKEECYHGLQCRKIKDPEHCQKYTHPSLPKAERPCKYGNNCYNRNDEQHRQQFSHD